METDPTMTQAEAVRAMLEENNRLLKEIQASTEKTRRYIAWGHVWSLLKIAVVVVPIIFGYLYLKPYVTDMLSTYQSLFGMDTTTNSANEPQAMDLMDQLKQYQQAGGSLEDLLQ